MLADVALLLVGSLCLYLGAEWLVKGAAGLARAMGVTPLAVGLTVVAYGTSAPELVVSTVAAHAGQTDIALGNVIGSNIANLGLILGITALISPPHVGPTIWRRELPIALGAMLAIPLLLLDGGISRTEGVVLLGGALSFTLAALHWSGRDRAAEPIEERPSDSVRVEIDPVLSDSRAKLGAFAVLGLAALVIGGKVFVTGAVGMASRLGMSERVIGLTVVAVGTSLPELAASLVAALRGHSEIAVGNVLGSNIFNVLLILGATALVHPIAASLSSVRIDLSALGILTVVSVYSMRTKRRISRPEGVVFLVLYAAFVLFVLVH